MATEEMRLSQQRTPSRLAKTPEDVRSLCGDVERYWEVFVALPRQQIFLGVFDMGVESL